MKKIFSALMALAMVLSVGITALAAEPDIPQQTPTPEQNRADMIAQIKASLPYKSVNIWLNGRYMTFEDAVPDVIDDRTQAPYRAVLEEMGAKVSYDRGNIEAVFEDGSVMKLAIGSKVMTYEKDGKVNTVNMDVAPFIQKETNRTFVPVRFIGEALGWKVTWSPELWVAYFVNWDKEEAAIDAQFSEFNEMMGAYAQAVNKGLEGNWKSEENAVISLLPAGMDKKSPLKLSFTGDTLTNRTNASGTYKMNIDAGALKTYIEADSASAELVKQLDGAAADVIVNMEKGLYMRSHLMPALTEGAVPADAWAHIDINKLYGAMGINLGALLGKGGVPHMTMGKLIRSMFESGEMGQQMGFLPPDMAAQQMLTVYRGLFGDECISIEKRGTVTIYEVRADRRSLADMINEISGGQISVKDAMNIFDRFTFSMKITLRGETLSDISVLCDIASQGMSIKVNAQGDLRSSTAEMNIILPEVINIGVQVKSSLDKADSAPMTEPPAGSRIISVENMILNPAA